MIATALAVSASAQLNDNDTEMRVVGQLEVTSPGIIAEKISAMSADREFVNAAAEGQVVKISGKDLSLAEYGTKDYTTSTDGVADLKAIEATRWRP